MSRFGVKEPQGRAKKPVPYASRFSEGFWDGMKAGELRLQACEACGHRQLPPKASCEECGSIKLGWARSSGKGRVYSFTIIRQVVMNSPAFEAEIPYALAMIDLNEGVRVVAQVHGCPPEQVRTGMDVEAYFDNADDLRLVKFRPGSSGEP